MVECDCWVVTAKSAHAVKSGTDLKSLTDSRHRGHDMGIDNQHKSKQRFPKQMLLDTTGLVQIYKLLIVRHTYYHRERLQGPFHGAYHE